MKGFLIYAFLFSVLLQNAQELFPLNLPASTLPKGVIGLREFNESYKEINRYRNLFSFRLMYGLSSKITLMASATVTNHHSKNFPLNLVTHTHTGNQTVYNTGNYQRGLAYPYQFTGMYFYGQYRFFSRDAQNKHFRMALYADASTVNVAHDETEPTLLDDTKGYGAGIITTYLNEKFAVSLTAGFIVPGAYTGFSPDSLGGPLISTKIEYGKALKYNLSFGYLLFPLHYTAYKQVNVNVYMELEGKCYQQARVYQYGGIIDVPIQTPLLKAGNFVEAHPGLQFIFNSNLRVDCTMGFPFINKSYARFYPIYFIGIQRYFYSKR